MTEPKCYRGEIWLVNFNPGRGSEQQGIRPALIIQNDLGNQYASTTIVIAITSTIKKYPVTVLLDHNTEGLDRPSMANCAQLLTIDKARLIKKFGQVDEKKLKEINDALKISLALL
jgi:mRNA interferase MazF